MTVLVTGGSGFLGRNLIRALLARGESVRALHRRPVPPFEADGLSWHRFEFGAPTVWPALLDGVTQLFHLAWSTLPGDSNKDPAADASINIGGTLGLLEAVRVHPVRRFIFASSGGTVYGAVPDGRASEDHAKAPLSAYGVSKLALEHYLSLYQRQWGVESVALRLSNPYGPDQESERNFGVVATFAANALASRPCTVFGDGRVQRDFIYVDDAVEALIAAGTNPSAAGIYNIGSGEGRSIADVIAAIEAATGRTVDVVYEPARPFDAPRTVLDASRAKADLGWQANTPFAAGVARVIAGQRQNVGDTLRR